MKIGRVALAAMVLTAAACTESGGPRASDRTQVYLTDAPFPYDLVSRVDIHVVSIDASTSLDTGNTGGAEWVNVVSPNRTINLLELQAGTTTLLGEADLPAGDYRAVRMIINTTLSSVTLSAGGQAPVQWPVQGELALHAYVEDPLEVLASGARIVVDFDVGRSFWVLESPLRFVFLPWIRAVNDAVTGTLEGTVTGAGISGPGPVANVAVSVLVPSGPLPTTQYRAVGTGRSDAQGNYRIAFLREHPSYIVRFEAGTCREFTNIAVVRQQVTPLDAAMPFDPMDCYWRGGQDTTGGGGGGGGGGDTTGTNPGGPVETVTVTPAGQTLSVGDSAGVYANLANAQGGTLIGRPVTFTSSNPAVVAITATFGQSALLRPLSSGSATITATSEGKTGTATVNVR